MCFFILNKLDLNLNGNDVIRNYQLSKINDSDFNDVSTVIIGDSSGGNAIDAKYFSKLTKHKTKNLSLTGSWGVSGSLGMLKRAYTKNPNIKNVIIIHGLDVWSRNSSKESILEFFSLSEIIDEINISSLFSYYFNPKEVLWNSRYFIKKMLNLNASGWEIDLQYDYIQQKNKRYSNNGKNINNESSLNSVKLSNDKRKELNMFQNFCHKNNLNCIFANGPIHQTTSNNSILFYNYLRSNIYNAFTITYIDKIFEYDNYKMGDSKDHIDVKYKDSTTYDYFLEINKYLQ